MRPSSLLGVLLDFLESLEDEGQQPADVRLSKFYRGRRYLGSHDRRFIGDAAYAFLRYTDRASALWRRWRERTELRPPESGRVRLLGPLLCIAQDGVFPWNAEELAEAASTFAAAAGGGWTEVIERVRLHRFLEEADRAVEPPERLAEDCSLPLWLSNRLAESRGLEAARELGQSLLDGAPVDLRVNLSRIEREVVRADLESGLLADVEFTPFSRSGLRLRNRVNLRQFLSRNPGLIEIQDEGSQLAALAAAATPGETIIDACAGSGGKSLAIADHVRGNGKFHVCDIDASKLARLDRRIASMELRSLTMHQISLDGPLPNSLPSKADLVVVDAPCSGLGSLRRNPDLKSRYTEEDIDAFQVTQIGILKRFAPRLRPGGRLLYITCSILREENEDVAERFLRDHPDFRAELPELAENLPDLCREGSYLRLDPVLTGTDGFFVARFRKAEPD